MIRNIMAVFEYMRSIRTERDAVNEGILAALRQFDELFAQVGIPNTPGSSDVMSSMCVQTFPNRPERLAPLWEEFLPQWNQRVVNYCRRVIAWRLTQMDNVWDQRIIGPQATDAAVILTHVKRLKGHDQYACSAIGSTGNKICFS